MNKLDWIVTHQMFATSLCDTLCVAKAGEAFGVLAHQEKSQKCEVNSLKANLRLCERWWNQFEKLIFEAAGVAGNLAKPTNSDPVKGDTRLRCSFVLVLAWLCWFYY